MKAREIRHTETLDYCDGIQLFAAEDAVGNSYVAALVGVGQKADQYLVVGCEPQNLLMLGTGATDLKSLIQQSAKQGWYLANVSDFGEPFYLNPQAGTVIPDRLLPGAGFYFDEIQGGDQKSAAV